MKDAGSALMGIGRATGENRAVEAARQAIASPLLEVDINGAQGILLNITGSSNLSLFEVHEAAEAIKEAADPEANIIFGTSFNERLGDEVMVTVIATGFDGGRKRHIDRSRGDRGHGHGGDRAAQPRERDFLEELQRQRDEASTTAAVGRSRATTWPRWSPRPAGRALRRRARRRPSAPRPTTPTTWRSRASSAGSDRAGGGRPPMTTTDRSTALRPRARDARPRADRATPARGPVATRTSVTLVAVSKTVDAERLRAAVAAGLTLLGENRVQEASREGARGARAPRGSSSGRSSPTRRAGRSRSFDGDPVGRLGRARRAARPARAGGPARVPATRSWSRSTSTSTRPRPASRRPTSTRRCRRSWLCRHLEIRGLMTVGRLATDAPRRRGRRSARCATCRRGCATAGPGLGPELSMGMTDDFELAVEEGATIVRVGRALFGERPHHAWPGRPRPQRTDG